MHHCDKEGIHCTTRETCDRHGCAAATDGDLRSGKALQGTITLGTGQLPDGTWCATMLVSGLADKRMAEAAIAFMRLRFCGAAIQGGY